MIEELNSINPLWLKTKYGEWVLDIEDIAEQLGIMYRTANLDLPLIGYTQVMPQWSMHMAFTNHCEWSIHIGKCAEANAKVDCLNRLLMWLKEQYIL